MARDSPSRTGIEVKDGEINCMIFLLALYLARTTPNEVVSLPASRRRP
jgi:hypothetical protein